jgi:hypothetical protein
MAEGFSAEAKDLGGSLKKNWLPALLVGAALVIFVLWYDHKNNGSLTTKIAGLPVVGKLFA